MDKDRGCDCDIRSNPGLVLSPLPFLIPGTTADVRNRYIRAVVSYLIWQVNDQCCGGLGDFKVALQEVYAR